METILDKPGAAQLLALLVVVLATKLIWDIFVFFIGERNRKDMLTETTVTRLTEALRENTYSIQRLDARTREMDVEFHRFKLEIRKILEMIRHLAGSKWPDVKQAASATNGEID